MYKGLTRCRSTQSGVATCGPRPATEEQRKTFNDKQEAIRELLGSCHLVESAGTYEALLLAMKCVKVDAEWARKLFSKSGGDS